MHYTVVSLRVRTKLENAVHCTSVHQISRRTWRAVYFGLRVKKMYTMSGFSFFKYKIVLRERFFRSSSTKMYSESAFSALGVLKMYSKNVFCVLQCTLVIRQKRVQRSSTYLEVHGRGPNPELVVVKEKDKEPRQSITDVIFEFNIATRMQHWWPAIRKTLNVCR